MAHMEDVLDLYAEPYDPQRPVVCFDETSTQAGRRAASTAGPSGHAATAGLRIPKGGHPQPVPDLQPLAGWQPERRTKQDFAHQMRLVDEAYPEAGVVRVVLDNRQGVAGSRRRRPGAWPASWSFTTPPHGSWLNMAEIEFSIVSRSCLGQRLPDEDTLCREVKALEQERNEARAVINWRFTTEDARRKLHRLYPAIPGVTGY